MGYNAYIVKCQCTHKGYQTLTITALVVKKSAKSKFTQANIAKLAEAKVREYLARIIKENALDISEQEFSIKTKMKGFEYYFIDAL